MNCYGLSLYIIFEVYFSEEYASVGGADDYFLFHDFCVFVIIQ